MSEELHAIASKRAMSYSWECGQCGGWFTPEGTFSHDCPKSPVEYLRMYKPSRKQAALALALGMPLPTLRHTFKDEIGGAIKALMDAGSTPVWSRCDGRDALAFLGGLPE